MVVCNTMLSDPLTCDQAVFFGKEYREERHDRRLVIRDLADSLLLARYLSSIYVNVQSLQLTL